MKILQKKFSEIKGWEVIRDDGFNSASCNFVMVFGSTEILSKNSIYESIRSNYPNANILLNSTAGEIMGTEVNDDSISVTAIYFEKTHVKAIATHIDEVKNSFEAGKRLACNFETAGLKNILVISDGQKVNGSELVEGLRRFLPEKIIITGGLAGDGSKFKKTLVGINEHPMEGRIAAIGFYGNNLSVGYGCAGGWTPFGPERLITRSKGNVLYELDGKPALEIYKMYLGEYAKELPSSGLLFPLTICNGGNYTLVRTILSVNEEENSLIFAGNMPEGYYSRLMSTNFDRLIEATYTATKNSLITTSRKPDFAVLISCVGRKLVLNQRIEEEIEAIGSIYGRETALTGFYSYGEISPTQENSMCQLHNQTITITTFTET